MFFHNAAKKLKSVPFTRQVILDILKNYKSPNDKISELVKKGELISIRRGLYVPNFDAGSPAVSPFLIANHLRGPSYVSLETALSFWGLIPERVYEISSATTKTSKDYENKIGRFTYHHLPSPYYSFGLKRVEVAPNQAAILATPEKALCDKIVLTSGIILRSAKQTLEFLVEDLRMEEDSLKELDLKMITSWLEDTPKKDSLTMLVKTIESIC